MESYLKLLREVMHDGEERSDRTGTGTKSLFGRQLHFDLQKGFPLVTTKKCHLRSIIHELLWFLQGNTNVGYLNDNKVSIWDAWADKHGDLGPVYGHQWRRWGETWRPSGLHPVQSAAGDTNRAGTHSVDQIGRVVEEIRTNPASRRLIVSAWNVTDIPKMALPPCHTLFQFYVHADERLSCQLYQRSADLFLGVPFNIASYALLTMMVASACGLKLGTYVHTFGDVHLYTNHMEQADLQLSRTPRELPTMWVNPEVRDLFSFTFDDFRLEGYNPHPAIKAPVAV